MLYSRQPLLLVGPRRLPARRHVLHDGVVALVGVLHDLREGVQDSNAALLQQVRWGCVQGELSPLAPVFLDISLSARFCLGRLVEWSEQEQDQRLPGPRGNGSPLCSAYLLVRLQLPLIHSRQ